MEHRNEFCHYGNKEDIGALDLVFLRALKSRLVGGVIFLIVPYFARFLLV